MQFIVEVEDSMSACKIFSNKDLALEYYQILLIGYEYMNDCHTNVLLKELDNHGREKILERRIQAVQN